MVDQQETIKQTQMFGLNTYEAKIWIALLSRGISTAGELSDIANVPRSRSYDVLESLEKKGFVVTKPGKPIKYLLVPPKNVLENIKKQIKTKKEKHISQIESTSFNNLINTFHELYEKNTNHEEQVVAILKGRKNIYKHLSFLLKNAKKDILFSVENKTTDTLEIINEAENKTKITTKTPNTKMRMSIVDDHNTLIFPIQESEVHPEYDLCIWIRHTHTTKFLKQLLTSI
jgi:sugar-specific transcriptional regulator TrmB